jgi:hypothetical protein
MLTRLWQGLPWDGLGWARCPDPVLAAMRARAADDWRRAYPPSMRPILRLADRVGGPLAALSRTWSFARALGLGRAATARVFSDCVATGCRPMDAHVWRALHGTPHPLPARSASLVLSRLGDPRAHALLADKVASAERLAEAGTFPALRALYAKGARIDLAKLTAADPDSGLFLKPRHGYGGSGAFALTRREGIWHVDGRPAEPEMLLSRLTRLCRDDDLLVQERLLAADALADLAADGRAPVLRLATARLPDGAPFLHSALLTLAVPGRSARHFLKGAIHAPVDPATHRLAAGMSFSDPPTRLERLERNGAQLTGRAVQGFAEAVAMVLRAMAIVPPIPLIHWDVVLTNAGPVLLEGNTSGNWILASLPGVYGLDAGPLTPILVRWARPAMP